MLNHIEGNISECNPTHIVVDCNGVGYHINLSLHTFSQIKACPERMRRDKSSRIKILVHLVVKEDAFVLYGFIDDNERQLFRHLISVSGIGPNTARMMLSAFQPQGIYEAIINKDQSMLQSIKGIGAKSAQRIIVELQDKLSKETGSQEFLPSLHNANRQEALSALIVLGFSKMQVEKILDKIISENPDFSAEDMIRKALKVL